MAIVEMRRVSLLGMAEDKVKLLNAMQRFGCVHVAEVEGDAAAYTGKSDPRKEQVSTELTRIRWAISQLNRYDTQKRGMLESLSMPMATAQEAEQAAANEPQLMGVVAQLEACERRSGELRGQEARARMQIDQLLPWKSLQIPAEMIRNTRDTIQYVGTVSSREVQALEAAFESLPVAFECIGTERESAYVWIAVHRSAQAEAQELLKNAEYSAASFAGETGTAAQRLDELHAQMRALQAERDGLEDEVKQLVVHLPQLKLLHELVAEKMSQEDAADKFARTGTAFLMEGWVPAFAAEKLEKKLRAVTPDIEISFRAPAENEKPPTLLQNNKVVAPFESIVTSYSYPDPRGIDPTSVMTPFYACLFGMMLSDAGYGLVMAIVIAIALKLVKFKEGTRKMMSVMFWCGLFTVFWGSIFNTWFGTNPSFLPTVIDTLNEPIPMLALCIGMGAIHLFAGLGVAAYMNIKRGKPLDAIYDQLSWILLLVGLALLLLPATATVGKWMAIAGLLIILLFAGRDKKNVFGRLLGGAGALYNISSWLSDLLSYMRLFGMGLATGVIGMVINMLVGLIMGNGIIGFIIGLPILVGGHLFNFGINALGAYVHSCRLQYIEFFSKFYEDGGIPFSPLAQKPLYYAIADTEGVES